MPPTRAAEKRKAEQIVRDAARQCDEIEEMARDLRRKLMDVFAVVAAKTIETSAGALAPWLGGAVAPSKTTTKPKVAR